mmetsp:Transcript_34620/g.99451  ORF Transcript_34620/g.99451 Transcript_34620/m.99451 type:complete len:238 (+) Transcript_34620:202-915(+)
MLRPGQEVEDAVLARGRLQREDCEDAGAERLQGSARLEADLGVDPLARPTQGASRLERGLLAAAVRARLLRVLRAPAVCQLPVGELGRHRQVLRRLQRASERARALRRSVRLRHGRRVPGPRRAEGARGRPRLQGGLPLPHPLHHRLQQASVPYGQPATQGATAYPRHPQLVQWGPEPHIHVVRGDAALLPQGQPGGHHAQGRAHAPAIAEGHFRAQALGALSRCDEKRQQVHSKRS